MIICWQCNKEIPDISEIFRQTACPFCIASLHCCKNCNFYDKFAHNNCKEPAAEWVVDKEKANFCEFFSYLVENDQSKPKSTSSEEAERHWKALLMKNKND